jgi:hypothetical protein
MLLELNASTRGAKGQLMRFFAGSTLALAVLLSSGCIAPPSDGYTAQSVDASKAQGLPFMLDDFEEETARVGTTWESSVDQNELGTHAKIERAAGGGISKASSARFFGALGKEQAPWPWAAMALNWRIDYTPADLRAVTGIRFWAKGDGKAYKLKFDKAAATDFAMYEFTFVAPAKWTQFVVPIEAFTQPSWGKPVPRSFEDTRQIQFAPTVMGQNFELFVDDIELLVSPAKVSTFPWPIANEAAAIPELPLAELAKRDIEYHPISLAAVANRSFEDRTAGDGKGGWTDQGSNSVPGFPTGKQTFQGIPFEIGDAPEKQVLVLRGKQHDIFPTRAAVPVGKKGKALYFLHSNAWSDLVNGWYEVVYADGSRQKIALRSGREVFDFWNPDDSAVARTAWVGKNPERARIGLTLFAWKNPKPDQPIQEIVARTPGDGAYLMLAGITLASDGPFLPPAPAIRFDSRDWIVYRGIDPKQRRGTALDMSRFLDAPAGKHGLLTQRGEDFVFSDGTPVRFWGMSLSDLANAPTHAEAEFMAEFFAQLGVNMLRHHLMDAHWSTGNNIFRGSDDTAELDPDYLERLDYFVAQLQKRGIYQNFDLIAQRKPFAKDGIAEPDNVQPGYKMIGEYDELAIKLQERFTQQLLGHKNRYTGKRYADDPALVTVAINNESTLFFLGDWGQGELKSEHHRRLLTQLYGGWLKSEFGSRDNLAARWAPKAEESGKQGLGAGEDPGRATVKPIFDFSARTREYTRYSRQRVVDNYRFLYALESKYQKRMTGAVRRTGYKGLITHTNHWVEVPIHQYVNSTTDWNDTHVYWAHPSTGYQYKAGTVFEPRASIQVADSLISKIAARRVEGLPHLISEWSSCNPRYRNDALIMMAAYSGLHNWSALQYTGASVPFALDEQRAARLDNVFDLTFQGGTLALWPAMSAMVLRRDVKPAPNTAYRPVGPREVFDPDSRVKLPEGLSYVTRTGMSFVADDAQKPQWSALLDTHIKGTSARSVTGELTTDWGAGSFKLDTPRSQALVGFLGAREDSTSNLSAQLKNEFVSVVLTSLTSEPLESSPRMLLSAVGNTINQGLTISESGTTIKKGGRAPILIEPMRGGVRVRGLKGATRATVHRLTLAGKHAGEVPSQLAAGELSFELRPEHRALHYEILIERR